MYSSDEEMYDGGYDEDLYDGGGYELDGAHTYDEEPGYDIPGYSGGEEAYGDEEHGDVDEEYAEESIDPGYETPGHSAGEEAYGDEEHHSEDVDEQYAGESSDPGHEAPGHSAGEEAYEDADENEERHDEDVDEEYAAESSDLGYETPGHSEDEEVYEGEDEDEEHHDEDVDEEYSEESNSYGGSGDDDDDDLSDLIRTWRLVRETLTPELPLTSYQPTTSDILQVRRYFSLIPVLLPMELVDIILDHASYWAHSSLTLQETANIADGGRMYLRTLPLALPNTEGDIVVSNQELHGGAAQSGKVATRSDLSGTQIHPCRKIEFQLWSHDQGWSSWPEDHGSYRGSWTWFDACIESPNLPSEDTTIGWSADYCTSSDREFSHIQQSPISFVARATEEDHPESAFSLVQKNIHASLRPCRHVVTWHYLDSCRENSPEVLNAGAGGRDWKCFDGSFVKRMQRGDCIALWMRARYPGWLCAIRKAKITVHWAV